ncbi:MAG: serine hydrolase domain-containing protein, partial [Pirellulaceae bacterium]
NEKGTLMQFSNPLYITGLLFTVVAGLLNTTEALAQAARPEDQATAAINKFLEQAGQWGFSAAVWTDGEVEWSHQWNYRDKEQELPVTSETMFRIGSVSKTITAMTLAAMAEQGQLSLDANIESYLPDLPQRLSEITCRQLAGHLAGIRHYDPQRMQQEFLSREQYDDQKSALSIFMDDPVLHAPGEEYLYSTYGYTLLGAVMEGAAEKPLIRSMRDLVFVPAGMTHSYGEHNEPFEGEIAVPYAVMNGRELIVPPINNSGKLAGGGLISTPEDLARFLGAVANHQIVSRDTLAEILKSQKTSDDTATGVGLGWRIATDPQDRRYIHHGGSAAGGRTFVLLYPDHDAAIALCMNLSSDQVTFGEELALEALQPFLDSGQEK